jgi:hypothetical protein
LETNYGTIEPIMKTVETILKVEDLVGVFSHPYRDKELRFEVVTKRKEDDHFRDNSNLAPRPLIFKYECMYWSHFWRAGDNLLIEISGRRLEIRFPYRGTRLSAASSNGSEIPP